MKEKIGIKLWLISLAVFALVVAVSMAVNQGDVTLGIPEDQAAQSAERVEEIQSQWREGGVRNLAIVAIICDLAWIWMYALGSFLVGKGFATKREGALRMLGFAICASAAVFAITDYTETILQFIQLLRDEGSDTMAQIASTMRPIKVFAFITAFFGIVVALVADRVVSKP